MPGAWGIESRFIYFPDEGHHVLKPANSRVFYEEMLYGSQLIYLE